MHGGGKRRLHNKRKLFDYYGRRRDYGDGNFPSIWPSEMLQDSTRGYDLEQMVPRDNYQEMLWEIAKFVPVSTGHWEEDELMAAAMSTKAAASPAIAQAFATMASGATGIKPPSSPSPMPDDEIAAPNSPDRPMHHLLYREKDFDESGVSLWESFYDYAQGEHRYYHRISKRVVTKPPGQ